METRFLGPFLIKVAGEIFVQLKEENGPRIIYMTLAHSSLSLLISEIYEQKNENSIFQFFVGWLDMFNPNKKLEKVVIYDHQEERYRAYASFKDSEANISCTLELKVTHALALSVVAKCPIFLSDDFLKKLNDEDKAIDEKKKFFNKLKGD